MNRRPPPAYADANMSSYVGVSGGQRMRGNTGAMSSNNFGGGRQDGYSVEAEQHPAAAAAAYGKGSKVEGQWHWDRDAANQLPPPGFNEGQGGNGVRPYYHGQPPDPKLILENQAIKEAGRTQPHEQDMELGYEDNALPITFEVLERKFFDEVMKLTKEQSDAEDTENARHTEKIVEINTRHQETLSALRAQQAKRREEFLCKESQARLSQYQQVGMSHYPSTGLQDARGYSGAPVAGPARETHRTYSTNQFEPYKEQPPYGGGGRTQATEKRVPYPEVRVYNNAGPRYY